MTTLKMYIKFEDCPSIETEKSVTEHLIGEKDGQIKGKLSSRGLILLYTIQQVIPNICTSFQNPRRSKS